MYMQGIQGNYKKLTGYEVVSENAVSSTNSATFIDLHQSISNAPTQPNVPVYSEAVSEIWNDDNSVTSKDTFKASLNDFVNLNGTANQKNNLLSSEDINYITHVANNHKWTDSYTLVDTNVKRFLNELPEDIREKLTVIVSTHELNQLPYYGRMEETYYSKVFVLGAVENEGAVIIDLPNKNFPSSKMLMPGSEFFSTALKPIITRSLGFLELYDNECYAPLFFRYHVPEFRFISSKKYINGWSYKNMHDLESPYTEKSRSSSLDNQLCTGSYRLNIFEFFSLVNNKKPWGDLIKEYNNTPYDRLGIEGENDDIQYKLIDKLEDVSTE